MELLFAFLTLTTLEIVLGIDNIVFIAIISGRLPQEQRSFARRVGLALAMVQRILLLSLLNWIAHLNETLFSIADFAFSGRALILIGGGIFLLVKATLEIQNSFTEANQAETSKTSAGLSLLSALVQITVLDIVFSLDSVITAVGMVNHLPIMIAAICAAVLLMLIFANSLSNFILEHPSIKMLALAFLLMVGVVLLADGFGYPIEKTYIYTAMGFSLLVEFLNFKLRSAHKANKS